MSANRGPAEDYLNQYKAGLKVGVTDKSVDQILVYLELDLENLKS